jgi:hypothetical protein
MRPGDDWVGEISDHLDQADMIILLVSSNYFASVFCGLEMERALELQKDGKTVVIPVMLRHFNLADAAFSHLNTCPPADRPIDSAAWPDKELALKTVSEQVGRLARELQGARPKNKLLHPNRKALTTLLHHLCDRGPQADAIYEALRPQRRKRRRPFVIIMQGSHDDSLEWFLNRLENVLLPRFLDSHPGRLSPLVWPEYATRKSPAQLFGPRLVDCLAVSAYATVKEMNAALPSHNAVNLLPSSVMARDWTNRGERLFEAYLQLWEEWPRLPGDYAFVPVLAIEHPPDAAPIECISQKLSELNLESRPNFHGVVLPPMGLVEHLDFKEWLRHEKVRTNFSSPEMAIERSNELQTALFPSAMHPLAERHLPRFLEQL